MTALKLASICIIVAAVIAFLIVAKGLLIPFVIAVLVWYIINALSHRVSEIGFVRRHFPKWSHLLLSALLITFVLIVIGGLIAENAREMSAALPRYQQNVQGLYERLSGSEFVQRSARSLRIEIPPEINKLGNFVSAEASGTAISGFLSNLISTLSGFAANGFLIVIYVVFLLIEQAVFPKKIRALFPDDKRHARFGDVVDRINESVHAYFTVKLTVSLLTAVASFVLMVVVGLDFAIFWAFLIFLLNFIPNIGSLIAMAFPALIAVLQFETLGPFFVILLGVGAIQLVVGNFIEPKMMGSSLNISSLVVIIALAVWGAIWGVAGMILCVPITVMMMIIFAQFPGTRPIAIILSEKGELMHELEEIHQSEVVERATEAEV